MALKGGTLLFLLIVTCAALALKPGKVPGKNQNFKNMARKLMRECQNKGYPGPGEAQLQTVFEKSDVPSKDTKLDPSKRPLSSFLNVLNSLVPTEDALGRGPTDDMDEMENEMMNRTDLSNMIKRMKNSSESSACYMKAFAAPLSWIKLTENPENNVDSDDYDTFLTAAEPVVLDMPLSEMNFPEKLKGQDMKKWMMMLNRLYDRMSKEKRAEVLKWAKQQITQNYFNCTTMPESDLKLKQLERCKPSLKWLDSDALGTLGPFLSELKAEDVDSSPKERLCEFFSSVKLKAALRLDKRKPSLAKKFLQRIKACYPDEEKLEEQAEKFGELACYFNPSQKLTPDLSKKLLPQLEQCDDNNHQIKTLKKKLINTLMSNDDVSQVLQEPGISITSFSAKQITMVPAAEIKKALKKLGPDVEWTPQQLKALVKKIVEGKKWKEIREELVDLGLVAGLPRYVLKQVTASKLLNNTEGLRTASKRMRKGKLKMVLRQLRKDVDPSELLEKLPGPLLRRVSLKFLEKANISLDQMRNKTWSKAQASFLVKKLFNQKKLTFRKLRSLLQGVTCKMIESTSDKNLIDMAQETAETSQWLTKVLVGCAARKLFSSLEKIRPDYFKTITEEELDVIPSALLLHLGSKKVEDLPDSVCSILYDKMENANLNFISLRGPSRLAFTKRALLCLTNEGEDLSVLAIRDVQRLGSFLCELSPLQMSQMKQDVLTYSLEEMALRCKHIPWSHRADLIQLVIKTYGNVSEWSDDTMENLGPLIALDDNIISALPNKPWIADVLYSLKSRLLRVSIALEKRIFDLIAYNTLSPARRRRTVKNGSTTSTKAPTAEQIEELNLGNVFWTPAQLDQISNKTFIGTVETLGSVPNYSADQLAVLSKKATEAFGPVPHMNETVTTQLGCISQGFSNEDLQKLPFSLDTLEEIAPCGWNESQVESVWMAAAKYNNLTAEQLGDAEMVSLNRFICGLNSNEMKQINKEAFKEAVDSMNDLQCSFKSIQQLTHLAVSVFGSPRTWTEADVATLGNIIAGLDSTELASLDPSGFSFLSTSSILLIPPKNFASFSVDQLMALGPDNAAVVTKEQRASLREDQLSAVDDAMAGTGPRTGSGTSETKPSESGAPSLTVEGIFSLMKPLLFLLMGFLLL